MLFKLAVLLLCFSFSSTFVLKKPVNSAHDALNRDFYRQQTIDFARAAGIKEEHLNHIFGSEAEDRHLHLNLTIGTPPQSLALDLLPELGFAYVYGEAIATHSEVDGNYYNESASSTAVRLPYNESEYYYFDFHESTDTFNIKGKIGPSTPLTVLDRVLWKVPKGLAGAVGINGNSFTFDDQETFISEFTKTFSKRVWSLTLSDVETYIPTLTVGELDEENCDNSNIVWEDQLDTFFRFPVHGFEVDGTNIVVHNTKKFIIYTGFGHWNLLPPKVVQAAAKIVGAEKNHQGIYVVDCEQANTKAALVLKVGKKGEQTLTIPLAHVIIPKENWVSTEENDPDVDCEFNLYPAEQFVVIGRHALINNCLIYDAEADQIGLSKAKIHT